MTRSAHEKSAFLIADRFEVAQRIDAGGMGDVYAGTDLETGDAVAVRLLSETWTRDPEAVARFEREVLAAHDLGQPGLEYLIDVGRLPSGRSYAVTPWLEGRSLHALLDGRRWEPDAVAALLDPISAALDALHEGGIVHRLVTPAKIRIATGAAYPRVILTGVGLGALLPREGHERSSGPARALAQLAYVAPELASEAPPGASLDVYAIATIAFELLAGRVPFPAPDSLSRALEARRRPPPSLRDVGRVPYPRFIEDALARGLAPQPSERFASAGAFVGDLWRGIHREPRMGRAGRRAEIPAELTKRALLVALGEAPTSSDDAATKMRMDVVDVEDKLDSLPAGASTAPPTRTPSPDTGRPIRVVEVVTARARGSEPAPMPAPPEPPPPEPAAPVAVEASPPPTPWRPAGALAAPPRAEPTPEAARGVPVWALLVLALVLLGAAVAAALLLVR